MSGQVSNFQNYLIALGNKFPSSQPKTVDIKPAEVQGTLDSCNNNNICSLQPVRVLINTYASIKY